MEALMSRPIHFCTRNQSYKSLIMSITKYFSFERKNLARKQYKMSSKKKKFTNLQM